MKSKKRLGIAFAAIIAVYFILGYLFLSYNKNHDNAGNSELTNDEGQEFAIQMRDAGQDAMKDRQLIYEQLNEGSCDRAELIEKLESSKLYLQENLKKVDQENDDYIELLYNSAFLAGLPEIYGDDNPNIRRQIEKQKLISTADNMHDYIVNRLYEPFDGTIEAELTGKMEAIKGPEIEQLADLMIEKLKMIIDKSS